LLLIYWLNLDVVCDERVSNCFFFFYRFGFNKWRDPMRPTQILAKICKEEGLDGPHYSTGRVRIDNKVFGATSQVLEESGMSDCPKNIHPPRRGFATA